MASTYPTTADSFTDPTSSSYLSSPAHSTLHQDENDAIEKIEAKLGTGSSTPTNNTFLIGNGTGSSAWSSLTSAQLAARVSDETGSGVLVFGTQPTIGTPTLTTPKVDTINESTAANGVTVDGLSIKDSKLNTNNSVVTANITDSNVTTAKIADNAITAILLDEVETSDLHNTTAVSATTWTDLKGNQNFTIAGGTASAIEATINASMAIGTTNAAVVSFRFVIDSAGTPVYKYLKGADVIAGKYTGVGVSSTIKFTGLAAGVHTIKSQIYTSANENLLLRASSVAAQEFLQTQVVEYQK